MASSRHPHPRGVRALIAFTAENPFLGQNCLELVQGGFFRALKGLKLLTPSYTLARFCFGVVPARRSSG